jgi:WS/DGAT/MGAT family acyltransferase
MDSLSSLDASFLYIENEFNHMHVAVIAIFEGPPPHGEEIEEMVSSKLHRVPRYRQKVRFVPFEIGRPVWSDDHHFNLRYHVRHAALPAPGSDEQLRTLVGRVMSQQLDRAKPLWEIWVVEGLEDDRWAMVAKTHHCMVDGVSGSDLLSVLLDDTRDADHPKSQNWEPEARPSGRALLLASLANGFRAPRESLETLMHALRAPGRALHGLTDLTDGLSTFTTLAKDEVETTLNGPIGPHRRWHWASTSISDVMKIRSAHGTTINDVVLSVISQAFRALMLSRGEPVAGLNVRTLVPVSVRTKEERGTFNNRVSAMFADLPMDLEDPVECLMSIRSEMSSFKKHHQSAAADTLNALTAITPPVLLALGARLFAGLEQHTVQTVTTNVPGPQHTLYAAGREMLTAYPYVPLAGSVRIGIAIFSYGGFLTFGITGDYDTAPDIDILAAGIQEGISELLARS